METTAAEPTPQPHSRHASYTTMALLIAASAGKPWTQVQHTQTPHRAPRENIGGLLVVGRAVKGVANGTWQAARERRCVLHIRSTVALLQGCVIDRQVD